MSKFPLWATGAIPCKLSKSCETHLRIFLHGVGEGCQKKSEIQHLKQETATGWKIVTAGNCLLHSELRWNREVEGGSSSTVPRFPRKQMLSQGLHAFDLLRYDDNSYTDQWLLTLQQCIWPIHRAGQKQKGVNTSGSDS